MEAEDIAKMVYAASQLSPQACVEDIILRPQLGDIWNRSILFFRASILVLALQLLSYFYSPDAKI